MVGSQAPESPARPGDSTGRVVGGVAGVPAETGGVAVVGGVGAGVPFNTADTTSRCLALKRGLHVVSVSRASVVGATTDRSLGFTTSCLSTSYRYEPWRVVMVIVSPGCISSSRKNGAP